MLLWLSIAVLAYLFNALSAVIDKFLITKKVPSPFVYTFFITILGILGIVLIPFGFKFFITRKFLLIVFAVGFVYIFALLSFFYALLRNEASRVVPIVGAVQPVIIFFLSKRFISESLNFLQIFAVILLVLGGILITFEPHHSKFRKDRSWIFLSLLSGLLFGVLYFLNKYLYINLGFITGFVWTRISTFLVALTFLFNKSFIKILKQSTKNTKVKSKLLFFIGQISGAMFFILINYAISLGSVTIINAMQGIQYVFVFVIMMFISKIKKDLDLENISNKVLMQKAVSILMIVLGIGLLVLK